jgi:hypothetical protein
VEEAGDYCLTERAIRELGRALLRGKKVRLKVKVILNLWRELVGVEDQRDGRSLKKGS